MTSQPNLASAPAGDLPGKPTCVAAPRGDVNGRRHGQPKVGPGPGATLGAGPVRLDPVAAGQVAAALHQHQHALARAGVASHPEVARLLRLAIFVARSGQHDRPGSMRAHAALVLDDDPTVTLPVAATLTGLSPRTIRRRIADGTLPVARVGRRVLVRRVDLDTLTA